MPPELRNIVNKKYELIEKQKDLANDVFWKHSVIVEVCNVATELLFTGIENIDNFTFSNFCIEAMGNLLNNKEVQGINKELYDNYSSLLKTRRRIEKISENFKYYLR